jgi:glycosyltransferase involved in cell wall biosynthesis
MKVLVANDLYGHSSAAGVAVRMAEGLAGRGHEVSFLATVQAKQDVGRETLDGVDVHRAFTPPYPLRFKAWRSVGNEAGDAAMKQAIEAVRPDVVHVHNLHIHLGYRTLAVARGAGAKVVLQVHDVMPFCHQKLFCHLDERIHPGDEIHYRAGLKCALCVKARWNPFRNRAIRQALHRDVDRVLAVSPEMSRALTDNDLPSHGVVPNGIPAPPAAPPATVAALRERLGLGGKRVIFHGGRLDRLKGSLELVRALELVLRTVPDAVLLLVGEALPGFRDELVSLARRLGLADDRLVFAGWLAGDELAAAYELADVAASPSLCFESFGLVNLEAMARGVPVVASMWGGPSDVVADGVAGYLVNPLHVDVMADRIRRILGDPALAHDLGRGAARRAREVFSLQGQVDAVEAVYQELVP